MLAATKAGVFAAQQPAHLRRAPIGVRGAIPSPSADARTNGLSDAARIGRETPLCGPLRPLPFLLPSPDCLSRLSEPPNTTQPTV